MEIASFELERWFAEHEHEADIMLAESGIRSLSADRFDTDPGELGYVIPTNGDPDLRARVAERYDRSADEVVFTAGTQEANLVVFLSQLDRDDHAVVVTPTYQALSAVPDAVGDVTEVELQPPTWDLDPDAVRDAMRPETELVVVNNPNNPVGVYHDRDRIEAVYDVAAEHDAYLLCDEVYRKVTADPIAPVASFGPHGISTTSVTKGYGLAGCRFGWVAGPESVVEAAWEWKDYTTISPSVFGQHVAKQALEPDREAAILGENRDVAATNREMVAAFVAEYGLDWYHPVGVNGFPRVPECFGDAREFCTAVVEEESVVLAPGDVFGFPDRFRIGFGLPTDELETGLERVGNCIERHR